METKIEVLFSVFFIMKLLEFVLGKSFFTYEGHHYKQSFGCAMGSPISAIIANLVIEHVEETVISNSLRTPCWWFRHVEGSHACLQKQHLQEFHATLNASSPLKLKRTTAFFSWTRLPLKRMDVSK